MPKRKHEYQEKNKQDDYQEQKRNYEYEDRETAGGLSAQID